MSTAIDKPKKKLPKLTPKQKLFADSYTDPNNKETFLNGTQSALKAYNAKNPKSAGIIAVENLVKPSIQNYIEQLHGDNGIGIEERSKLLADMLLDRGAAFKTTTRSFDADGNITGSTQVDKQVTATQKIKLLDLANKTEGIYNRANIAEHVAKREHDERITELRKALSTRLKGKGGGGQG